MFPDTKPFFEKNVYILILVETAHNAQQELLAFWLYWLCCRYVDEIFLRRLNVIREDLQCFNSIPESSSEKREEKIS